jgi:hypothetical protein
MKNQISVHVSAVYLLFSVCLSLAISVTSDVIPVHTCAVHNNDLMLLKKGIDVQFIAAIIDNTISYGGALSNGLRTPFSSIYQRHNLNR